MPNSPWNGVLVALADGARPDVMERLAAAGELPTLRRHFIDRGGFRSATSVFPTVSGPAHLPVLSGVHPGRANLPGIRWAERPGRGRSFLGRTRSYMSPFRAYKLERDVSAEVTTLFHHVPAMADVNTWFVRGCPGAARRTRWSKALSFVRCLTTKDWYGSDRQAERAVVGAFEAGYRSAFAVFPAIDELGHRFGPLCDETYESYRRFDAALGRVMDGLARLGRADDTLVMITSDHGQSTTHTHLELGEMVSAVYPRTLVYPRLWRHLFNAEAAVMVSGNSMANLYLRGPSGWDERPPIESGRPAELCASLLAHEGIGLVIYRRDPSDPRRRLFVVESRRGKVVIDAGRPETAEEPLAPDAPIRLTVQGESPLGDTPPVVTRGHGSADSAYPDAIWQVVEFFRSSRAGDLVVCAAPGYDLRGRFEYQPHLGSHGCLDREHMLIPAAVTGRWGPGPIRSVDLFPSVLAALGRPIPRAIDGEALSIARS